MIKTHEKPEDRMMEVNIATAYCREMGYTKWMKHSPDKPYETPDILCYVDERLMDTVEIRRRYGVVFTSYTDWGMECEKVNGFLAAVESPTIVFAMNDVFGYVKPASVTPRLGIIKHNNPRDNSDEGPGFFYAQHQFVKTWDRGNHYPIKRYVKVKAADIPILWVAPSPEEEKMDNAPIWVNPHPKGSKAAQEETKKQIMLAMMGDTEYTEEEKDAMRIMWKKVMAETALLADYRKLADRVAPEPPPLPEIPVKVFTNEDFVF